MIDRFAVELPHGISLSCRASGREDAPVLLFLHGAGDLLHPLGAGREAQQHRDPIRSRHPLRLQGRDSRARFRQVVLGLVHVEGAGLPLGNRLDVAPELLAQRRGEAFHRLLHAENVRGDVRVEKLPHLGGTGALHRYARLAGGRLRPVRRLHLPRPTRPHPQHTGGRS